MLHRLVLRVLPQLHATVTDAAVRKRKRWVMLVPGLVAFALYRLFKDFFPLSDPVVLFALAGVLATLTALWAYVKGRAASFSEVCRTEHLGRLLWVGGWIGFVYGVQLAVLVLALLSVFVGYHFWLHPDGPAMMALIISCTAVTRDAFEIGHVVRMESSGMRLVTFPDGGSFRAWLRHDGIHPGGWVGAGFVAGAMASVVGWLGWIGEWGESGQAMLACVVAACFAHGAFWAGSHPRATFPARFAKPSWWEACRFWVWPCLTFALTYYLVQIGFVLFVLQVKEPALFVHAVIGGVTGGMMAAYGYFLGSRVFVEMQTQGGVSEGLTRCPFVMEILAKTGWVSSGQKNSSVEAGTSQPDRPSESLL